MGLVSVLSLAAVWIPLVLAGGWLLSLGSSVLLLCGWWWVFGEGSSVHRPKAANGCHKLLVRHREIHRFAAPWEL